MNSNYYEYQIDFDECIREGFTSFASCPLWAQERMAKNYWLSFDKPERMKFLAHIDELVMEAAADIDRPLTQTEIEAQLIEFYGPEIDKQFKAVKRRAA